MEKDELEEKREEVQKAGDEIKVLKEENQALKDKLKEKDKIFCQNICCLLLKQLLSQPSV